MQMVTVLFYYFACGFSSGSDAMAVSLITQVLCWGVAAVTVVSGAKYLWENRDCLTEH